jgi:deferrochelatase/peroxidase EfeB
LSRQSGRGLRPTRRGLVGVGVAALAGTGFGMDPVADDGRSQIEPFWGPHQGGITTPMQGHTYAAAFDLVSTKREDVIRLLRAWTSAAARMGAVSRHNRLGEMSRSRHQIAVRLGARPQPG